MPHSLVAALLLALVLAAPSSAIITDLTWDPPVVLASGVDTVPAGEGTSLVFHEGRWHIVYAKANQVFHAVNDSTGWSEPEALTSAPAVAVDPHLAADGSWMHLVWEDSRSGHPEVWTRRFDGTIWTPEECLTADETPSADPVIAESHSIAAVAWVEGAPGVEQVLAKFFEMDAWGSNQVVSSVLGAAVQPSVSGDPSPYDAGFCFAWSDARNGSPQIYVRFWFESPGWRTEYRVADLPGSCSHPSIHLGTCCSDWVNPFFQIAFEHEAVAGVPEVWMGHGNQTSADMALFSADDGVPSTHPNLGGFDYLEAYMVSGGWEPVGFLTWSDADSSGATVQRISRVQWNGVRTGDDILGNSLLGPGVVAAHEGPLPVPTPAPVLAAWIESVDGVPTLVTQSGENIGCWLIDMVSPFALLLAPEGFPANEFQMTELCRDEPYPGVLPLKLSFSPALDADLTWAPFQTHPTISMDSDNNGHAIFALRGGGCSQAGPAVFRVLGMPRWGWGGAKSPDVDGDCAVRDNDVEYVQAQLGTSDFCADLDGSGLVDEADLAIVQATHGDHCSNVVGVDADAARITDLSVRVTPNPTRGVAVIRFELASPGAARVRVIDAGGRLLREWVVDAVAGTNYIAWDGLGDTSERLAAGWYVATASVAGQVRSAPFVVTR